MSASADDTAAERGQATILGLAIVLGAVALGMLLLSIAQVYLAQERLHAAARLAAVSLEQGRGGDQPEAAAVALAHANGARTATLVERTGRQFVVVSSPTPHLLGVPLGSTLRDAVPVEYASDGASGLSSGAPPSAAHGAWLYTGPLVRVDAALLCPRVAASYRQMQHAAAAGGIGLYAVSGYRSYDEQASLYAALGPRLAAPPGTSLHHRATELDLAVGSAGSPTHAWLTVNAGAFGWVQRYSWGYLQKSLDVPELVVPVRRTACNRTVRVDSA